MDDCEILALLWNRAEEAIAALAQRFGSQLMRTARNLLGPEDAEECVSDTYLAIWNAIPPRRPEPLTPFVLRVGRNIALNRLRSQNARQRSGYELSLDELAGCIPAPQQRDPQLGEALTAWLGTLKRDNRVIFLRRYWFGDSVKEIAAEFGMRESAVSVRLSRMRESLRQHLNMEGYTL